MPELDAAVESSDVSQAWARAILHISSCTHREASPLIVSIATTNGVQEDPAIRAIADRYLARCRKASVGTVASTIFPESLWEPGRATSDLYARYLRIWPRVKRVPANRNGTYFRRMTSFGSSGVNQIEHVISTWRGGNHRRSALQLALFDPERDHTHQRQRGFPCLHQVALVPTREGGLTLNAFYAMQLVFEKGYGNYLGLARLGVFLAHQMGVSLSRVTCIASVGRLSQAESFRNPQREALRAELESELAAS